MKQSRVSVSVFHHVTHWTCCKVLKVQPLMTCEVTGFQMAYVSRKVWSIGAGSLVYAETARRGSSPRPLIMMNVSHHTLLFSSVDSVGGVADSTTCRRDFDSDTACKRSCERVKSLDGLPSNRGSVKLSSLMFVGIKSLSGRLYKFPWLARKVICHMSYFDECGFLSRYRY